MQTVPCATIPRNPQPAPVVPEGPGTLPEAPVSLNCFVDLPGVGRTQVTARGASGLEAAQNLKGSVGALADVFAPAPLPPRSHRLAALLACAHDKALAARDDARFERLTRAYTLVARGFVEEVIIDEKRQGVYRVHSQREPLHTVYTVQHDTCDCPDKHRHQDDTDVYWCKHAIAAHWARKLDKQEAAHAS